MTEQEAFELKKSIVKVREYLLNQVEMQLRALVYVIDELTERK